MSPRGSKLVGVALILAGAASVASGGWVYYDAWTTRATWDASPEAQAIAAHAAEPTPVWLDASTTGTPAAPIQPVPAAGGGAGPRSTVSGTPTPGVRVSAADLSLDSADFTFLDPPEPGAHARLTIAITNHGATTSNRILLGLPSKWFDAYDVIGTAPAVTEDRTDDQGQRTFSFPPILSAATANYELHVTSKDEGTTAPAVAALLANGDKIGDLAKPTVFAPTPRPGPVMSLEIPRLKLKSPVIQIAWEPPPFSVGQIKTSAHITQGNTVLIGHLTGLAGNVFAHLDQLKPGDEITATSRGLPYKFVVSRIFEGSNNDATPMDPVDDGRLTLMTCAGVWNPFTHDYSKRLWVVAEPPEQAAVTIAQVAATATVEAAVTATALALEPTATATPMPYAGEPSPSGGLGNTRTDWGHAYGAASGETAGKQVVYRLPAAAAPTPAAATPVPTVTPSPAPTARGASGKSANLPTPVPPTATTAPASQTQSTGLPARELHVAFTPDPQRVSRLSVVYSSPVPVDTAARETRRLLPADIISRAAPEGSPEMIVERLSSPSIEQALGSGDLTVISNRDSRGAITSVVIGLGDDVDALSSEALR